MLDVKFKAIKLKPPFDSESVRKELLALLNHLGRQPIWPAEKINGVAQFRLDTFVGDGKIQRLLDVMDTFVAKIYSVQGG